MMKAIHTRMPVILSPHDYAAWIDPDRHDAEQVVPLLRPYPAELMLSRPVSTYVNNLRNERVECAETVQAD